MAWLNHYPTQFLHFSQILIRLNYPYFYDLSNKTLDV